MATKILSKTAEYGIIRQDPANAAADGFKAAGNDASKSWNDPGVAGTNYRRVPYNKDSVVFDPGVTIDQYQSSGQNGLHHENAQTLVDGRSGIKTMSFAMPMDKTTLAPHLVGALLPSTGFEAVGTPYTKTIPCGGLTGTIDFTANGTPLHTLSMTDIASADDGIILEDCIIGDLNLEWDFLAQGIARFGQMSGTWVGSEMNFEQTMTGTTVDTTLTPYNNAESYSLSTFTVDSVDWSSLPFRKFTFSVNNNVTYNDATTLGKPDQYDVMPEYRSTILLNYDSTTEKIRADFQAGALVVATFASSTSKSADGGLEIAATKGILQSQPVEYNGEFLGVMLDIRWEADGATTPVTITMSDTLDWGYV